MGENPSADPSMMRAHIASVRDVPHTEPEEVTVLPWCKSRLVLKTNMYHETGLENEVEFQG